MAKKEKRPMRPEDWDVFKRTLKYAQPYKTRLILGVLFGLIFAGSMVGLLPTAREYLGQIFDIEQASLSQTLMVGGIMILLGFGRGIGQFISFYYIEWVGNRVVTDLRIESFTKLQTLSMRYFSASKSGDIISRVSTDSIMVQHAVSTVMKDLVSEPF